MLVTCWCIHRGAVQHTKTAELPRLQLDGLHGGWIDTQVFAARARCAYTVCGVLSQGPRCSVVQCSQEQPKNAGMLLDASRSPPQHSWGCVEGYTQAAWPSQTALQDLGGCS